MKGYAILNGGEPFSPRSKDSDHAWLQLIRPAQNRPRVMVVPAAVIGNPRRDADQVMRYFNLLGTFAEYKMIVDQQSANTESEYKELDKVDAIVLPDGSSIDMVERLQGTRAEAAMRRALERKAALMGTGGSAMALGATYWFANEWLPGLGILPHLAVLPYHNIMRMRLEPERLLEGFPEGVTLVGVDQATALLCRPDSTYEVLGQGTVTVYRSTEELIDYEAGSVFTLA